jgi:hypothetical protein
MMQRSKVLERKIATNHDQSKEKIETLAVLDVSRSGKGKKKRRSKESSRKPKC